MLRRDYCKKKKKNWGGEKKDFAERVAAKTYNPQKAQPCATIMICQEFGNRSKIAKVARVHSRFNHVVNEGRLPASVAKPQLLH